MVFKIKLQKIISLPLYLLDIFSKQYLWEMRKVGINLNLAGRRKEVICVW